MDSLDLLIIDRLGEHKRKADFISRNLRERCGNHIPYAKIVYAILSVAACLVIAMAISPLLFNGGSLQRISITEPSFTGYRGNGYNRIETAINDGNYDAALSMVEVALSETERKIDVLSDAASGDEETEYLTALANDEKEQLLWAKIYLSVKLNKKDTLITACHKYLDNSMFYVHKKEVEHILKIIE